MDQGRGEDRSLADTLDRACQVLATLPRRELTMLPARILDARYPAGPGDPVPVLSPSPDGGRTHPSGSP